MPTHAIFFSCRMRDVGQRFFFLNRVHFAHRDEIQVLFFSYGIIRSDRYFPVLDNVHINNKTKFYRNTVILIFLIDIQSSQNCLTWPKVDVLSYIISVIF